ncbi:MAG: thiopeptide-type bacteriocin [Burkholderiales bacterium]
MEAMLTNPQQESSLDFDTLSFEIEDLTITEVSDALQLPETAASCIGSCTCCCSSVAALNPEI